MNCVNAAHVALFSFAVQVVFLLALPGTDHTNSSTDFFSYYNPVAQSFLQGKGLTLNSGEFGTQYPPGFPLFLAGSYAIADALHVDRMNLVIGANLGLMTVACILVFATARRLFSPAIAAFSALLWSTYIFNLWLIKQPNSEVPFLPLFVGAVYSLIVYFEKPQLRIVALCGLLLGLAALIRPTVILLPAVFSAIICFRRGPHVNKRTVAALALVIAFASTILPWEAALYSHTHAIVPLSTNGSASILDGLTFIRRNGLSGVPQAAEKLMRQIQLRSPELQTTGDIARCLAEEAAQNPLGATELFFLKAVRSWFGTDSGRKETAAMVVQLVYLVLAIFGFLLMARRLPRRWFELKLFLAIVAYFWLMALIALSILRYMVPAMAYLLIPAATVPAMLLEGARRRPQFPQDASKANT